MLKLSRRLHNWLGLLLAIQIMLWFLSGLVMAILPIEQVRGEHLRLNVRSDWKHAAVAPATVLAQHGADASLSLSIQLALLEKSLVTVPVYNVTEQHQLYRYNAITGAVLQELEAEQIMQLAKAQYLGRGSIFTVQLLPQAPQEVKNLSAPLWQVQFDDADDTTFYLDRATGLVQRVRTTGWRLFDFFWMLHIMDYKDRSNFNNPLLISTAAAALLFTLTGLVLLWQRFLATPRRRRYS